MKQNKTLKRRIIQTQDGSSTVFIPDWNENYHSKHGAIRESEHVFLKNGLHNFSSSDRLNILEMGFGTGLNVLLTILDQANTSQKIHFTSLEKFPLSLEEIKALNYSKILGDKAFSLFEKIHAAPWEEEIQITDNFYLHKRQIDIFNYNEPNEWFDLIYYDAFGSRVQPDLWTETVFSKMYNTLKKGGLLTTYAANGNAKRALIASGFEVKKMPGPPGKREMMNAWKK